MYKDMTEVVNVQGRPPRSHFLLQIKKISVFQVKGLKILGTEKKICVPTHTYFFYFFFSGKYIILYILKGISPFKMHEIIFFQKIVLDFTSKFR